MPPERDHEQLLTERQEAIDHGAYVEEENDRLRAEVERLRKIPAEKREALSDQRTCDGVFASPGNCTCECGAGTEVRRLRAEYERVCEQYAALQRTWHKSIEAVHLAVAQKAQMREMALHELARYFRDDCGEDGETARGYAEQILSPAFDEEGASDA